MDRKIDHYPKFVHVGLSMWFKDHSDPSVWCCSFLQSSGIIQVGTQVYNPKRICFETLIVPRMAAFRYPTQEDTPSLKHLQTLALINNKLPAQEWSETDQQPFLFYDRKGSRRRQWWNSKDVANELETKYFSQARVVGQEWNDFNFTDQISLFNTYPRIVSPHGAHLSHLFFSSPGTKLVENICNLPGTERPAPVELGSKDEVRDWYGTPPVRQKEFNWFSSFSRQLEMEHFTYMEHEGCMDKNGALSSKDSPKKFQIHNVSLFVEFLASRFELRRRSTRS